MKVDHRANNSKAKFLSKLTFHSNEWQEESRDIRSTKNDLPPFTDSDCDPPIEQQDTSNWNCEWHKESC